MSDTHLIVSPENSSFDLRKAEFILLYSRCVDNILSFSGCDQEADNAVH